MRVDLALQCVESGLQEQSLLLFQLQLNSSGIPDLDRNGHSRNGAGVNRNLHPEIVAAQKEKTIWEGASNLFPQELKQQDADKECNLPIMSRPGKVAAEPTVNAEIHYLRDRPDFCAVSGILSKSVG